MSGILSNQQNKAVTTTADKEPGITTSTPGFTFTERETKERVKMAANAIDALSVMGMSRKDRRRIAKINGLSSIKGSVKPFVKTK